jgi:predicted amidohydrolase
VKGKIGLFMKECRQEAKISVAVLQPSLPAERDEERLARVEGLVAEVTKADLLLLPELWRVGCTDFSTYKGKAEPLSGETLVFLQKVARGAGAYLLGGSLIESAGEHLYNTAVLLDRTGEIAGIYRKLHLLNYRSQERIILTPGEGCTVVATPLGNMGIAICYDLRFPELFREMSVTGAEVFLVPAAWPSVRLEAWEVLCRARAVENQAYVVACNATGKGLLGHSMVVDPWGVKIASLGRREGVLRAELDLAALRRFREEFPVWRER